MGAIVMRERDSEGSGKGRYEDGRGVVQEMETSLLAVAAAGARATSGARAATTAQGLRRRCSRSDDI